jgi:hypothetical protein
MDNKNVDFDKLCQQVESFSPGQGVSQSQILNLPHPFTSIFVKIVRQGSITAVELADDLSITIEQSHHLAVLMVEKGLLYSSYNESTGTQFYRARHARSRSRSRSNVWEKLDL